MQCKAKRNHDERQGAGGPQPLYYSYCKKTGHIKVNCFKKNRRSERNGGGNDYGRTRAADDVFNSVSETSESSENIWIGDSGTSYATNTTVIRAYSMLRWFQRESR